MIPELLTSSAAQTLALGAVGGAATWELGFTRLFNHLSGASTIERNTGAIIRAAEDYAALCGLNIEDIRKVGIKPSPDTSILFADAENASITIAEEKDGKLVQRTQPIRLGDEGGLVTLRLARAVLDNPLEVFRLFSKQLCTHLPAAQLKEIKKDRETWARPSSVRSLWGIFSHDVTADVRITKTRDALLLVAKVLAASTEANIDLSGPCHIALKVTDPETHKVQIIVMPTTRRENKLIRDIESGRHKLPEATRSSASVRQAICEANKLAA